MEKSKVIQFEKNDKDNGKEQARQILKNGILEVIISMKWEKAYKLCTQITGKIIDDSVKNCCIFVYLDGTNYDKDEYIEVTWDELMEECEPVEVIVCE